MSNFSFLEKYILPSTSVEDQEKYCNNKHFLFDISSDIVTAVDLELTIPIELKEFYLKIGYGFFDQKDTISTSNLFSPSSFKAINLREDYYEFDPELEMYEIYNNKSLFYEVNEGMYLLIDNVSINGKNAIYYFDSKIANSLEEFLLKVDSDPHYFE